MTSHRENGRRKITVDSEVSISGLVTSFLGDRQDLVGSALDTAAATTTATATAKDGTSTAGWNESERKNDDDPWMVNVVIFSKDRPWQLQQLLKSFQLQQTTQSGTNERTEQRLSMQIFIIVRVQDSFRRGYERVFREYEAFTTVLEERPSDDDKSFRILLLHLLSSDEEPLLATHWLFLTDDCVLLVPLFDLLETACQVLTEHSDVACFLSRLHTGISWCQTRGKPALPPTRFMRYEVSTSKNRTTDTYVYPLKGGALDWNYPWDLSGGIYRNSLVRALFNHLRDTESLSHPNTLEISGNQALATHLTSPVTLCSVPTMPMLLILAINRVQNVCRAPLACDEEKEKSTSAAALSRLLDRSLNLDLSYYRARHFNSSHIGDLALEAGLSGKPEFSANVNDSSKCKHVALSVLIPVHSGPPEAAYHAMISIAMQPFDLRDRTLDVLCPLQIVLVDDRCVDGSIDAMLEATRAVGRTHDNIVVSIVDHRIQPSSTHDCSFNQQPPVVLMVDVYASPRPGIASALNHGLDQCASDVVARMDADDICAPDRFYQQLIFLRSQREVAVVGTNTIIFRGGQEAASQNTDASRYSSRARTCSLPFAALATRGDPVPAEGLLDTRVSIQPSDAWLTSWSMMFSCCVAHPSVMFRKHAVQAEGGYEVGYSSAEDYALWLKMTSTRGGSLVTVPFVGVWHRKHNRRPSKVSTQSREAVQAATRAIASLVEEHEDDPLFSRTVTVVRKPDVAMDRSDLDNASSLLLRMERCFFQRHSGRIPIRDSGLIREDCNARLGELASLVCSRFATSEAVVVNDSVAWTRWCERCPHESLTRIALLGTTKNQSAQALYKK